MKKVSVFALSVNAGELENKLLKSLHNHYTEEEIAKWNFQVVCQGYSPETLERLRVNYGGITLHAHEKIRGPISYIRDTLVKEYNVLNDYEYVIFIDDDFKYGSWAFRQYEAIIKELDENPNIGFVAMHKRLKKENREKISPLEYPYPHDLGVISMRTGLLVRTAAVPESGLFSPDIAYHEEMYMAAQIYLNGYEVAKGWLDIFHQSNRTGLGCQLQREHRVTESNSVMSSKKKLYELGLFEVEEGQYFYEGQDIGKLTEKAHNMHKESKLSRT